MALELRPNDNAREGRPSVWIFSGRSIVYLVLGVALAIALFRLANLVWGFDVLWSLIIGSTPLAAVTLFVQLLVNGKPPSYAWDVICWGIWGTHAWLYRVGIFDRPPQFWVLGRKPRHPHLFMGDQG
jgi:hypothetical protein